MGFIGVFFLSIIFILFLIGTIISFIGLIIGIILNIIFTKKKNEGKRYGKIWAIIARIQIAFCSVLLLPCLILGIIGLVDSASIPSDFIETEYVIEYYNERELKTNDSIYVAIKLDNTKYYGYYDRDEKLYSYMPSGLFNKKHWTNFYTIKNDTNCEFICVNSNIALGIYEYSFSSRS